MVKIAFHSESLDIRGTCVALYDYAHYNEILLKNESIILTSKNKKHDKLALDKFINRFEVRGYYNNEEFQKLIEDCSIIYHIKYGKNDNFLPKNIKNIIHCVFDMSEPHGDVYAGVSDTLAKKFNKPLFVPHMASLQPSKTKENLRKDFNIPENAIVFGRHGGRDTFDLPFVRHVIKTIIRNRSDIYFIFVNTPPFDNHKNIIFFDQIVNDDDKNKFICTCDAMIHAQLLGETFGLAISEFSVNNKPIITYGGDVWNDNYKNILQNNALYYYDAKDLYNILNTFSKKEYINKDLNFYKEYSPEKVMKIFKKVFID